MINPLVSNTTVALDSQRHRHLKLQLPVTDWSVAARLNAVFIAAAEFGDVCREYPIVFVRAGEDEQGRPQVAPVAVLGLSDGENLYLDGPRWRAMYLPALLRSYPFGIARMDAQRFAVSIDGGWSGLSETEGQPLFEPDGTPTDMLKAVHEQLGRIEREVRNTRMFCQILFDLDILREMRFDATLPDGNQLGVDGFLTVDESRLNALSDAQVLELHRTGALSLVHAHWVSLGVMRQLVQRRAEQRASA
jgi:hypothetical protein